MPRFENLAIKIRKKLLHLLFPCKAKFEIGSVTVILFAKRSLDGVSRSMYFFLCTSQFQVYPFLLPVNAGHLPLLSVPRVGHKQVFRGPGVGHLLTLRPPQATQTYLPSNYREFNWKHKDIRRLAHLPRKGKTFRGFFKVCSPVFMPAFCHCLSI